MIFIRPKLVSSSSRRLDTSIFLQVRAFQGLEWNTKFRLFTTIWGRAYRSPQKRDGYCAIPLP